MSASFLITGLRSPAALDWVRRLGRAGHRVAAADSLQYPLGYRSRYLTSYRVLPWAVKDSSAYADAVLRAAEECGAEWVIPTGEETFYLSKHRERFEGKCRLLVSPLETLERLHHKGRFAEWTRDESSGALPIQAPETWMLRSGEELQQFVDSPSGADLGNWVFKAGYSRFSAKVLVRPSRDQVMALRPSTRDPWLAQRYAPGESLCSYSLVVNGRVMAHSAYRPLYCHGQGAGYFFEPTADPRVEAFVQEVVQRLRFTGQIAFDFIRSEQGIAVIECNPRSTSGLFLLRDEDPLPYLTAEAVGLPWQMEWTPKMLKGAMWFYPGRRKRWNDYRRAVDVTSPADDPISWWQKLRYFRELFKRSKSLPQRYCMVTAATFDFEWNGQ